MTRRAYAIIIACFFNISIAYSLRYAYGMLLPEMLPALGITKTEAGVIYAGYFIFYTVFTPILGTFSDLFNYRFIVTLCTAVSAVGSLLMGYADSLFKAGLFFSLIGLGHAACWAPVAALVMKWVPNNKRATALSFVTMGVSFGIPLWSILLPIIVSSSGWRTGWLSMGFFGIGVTALNFWLVRNPPDTEKTIASIKENLQTIWSDYKRFFKNKIFWIIGVAYLLVGFNVLIPFTFLPIYARECLHLEYAVSTRFFALIALFGISGQMTLGRLSDTMGRVNILILCSLIMGFGCLGIIFSQTALALYVCTAFYGVGYGAVWPVYAASASDYFSRNKTGTVVGLWTVFLGLGSIVSPVISGWAVDKTGGYFWTFGLGFGSGLISALILLQLLILKVKPVPVPD
jgi:MFS family permease